VAGSREVVGSGTTADHHFKRASPKPIPSLPLLHSKDMWWLSAQSRVPGPVPAAVLFTTYRVCARYLTPAVYFGATTPVLRCALQKAANQTAPQLLHATRNTQHAQQHATRNARACRLCAARGVWRMALPGGAAAAAAAAARFNYPQLAARNARPAASRPCTLHTRARSPQSAVCTTSCKAVKSKVGPWSLELGVSYLELAAPQPQRSTFALTCSG
jgi:hypothetical protein